MFKLQVELISSSGRHIKRFLLFTNPANNLYNVAEEIVTKCYKLYPQLATTNIEIQALQDIDGCDLDPDFTVSEVFSIDTNIRVILNNELRIDSNEFSLYSNFKSTNKRRKLNNNKSENHVDPDKSFLPPTTTIQNLNTDPEKSRTPISNTLTPSGKINKRITSGMLQVPEPKIQEFENEIDAFPVLPQSSKKNPSKKQLIGKKSDDESSSNSENDMPINERKFSLEEKLQNKISSNVLNEHLRIDKFSDNEDNSEDVGNDTVRISRPNSTTPTKKQLQQQERELKQKEKKELQEKEREAKRLEKLEQQRKKKEEREQLKLKRQQEAELKKQQKLKEKEEKKKEKELLAQQKNKSNLNNDKNLVKQSKPSHPPGLVNSNLKPESDSSSSQSSSSSSSEDESTVKKSRRIIVDTPKGPVNTRTPSMTTPKKPSTAESPITFTPQQQFETSTTSTVNPPSSMLKSLPAKSRPSLHSLSDLASRGVPDVKEKSQAAINLKLAQKKESVSSSESEKSNSSESSSSESSSSDSSSDEDDGKFISAESASQKLGKKKKLSGGFASLLEDIQKK